MAWKIMEERDGMPCTLFHGVNGSRTIPLNTWVDADMKEVSDGSSATTYMSGWHLLPTREDCVEYLRKFKNLRDKVIVHVGFSGKVWPKSHSRSEVFLAERLFISRGSWGSRIHAGEIYENFA
jgi:hypothetical protein